MDKEEFLALMVQDFVHEEMRRTGINMTHEEFLKVACSIDIGNVIGSCFRFVRFFDTVCLILANVVLGPGFELSCCIPSKRSVPQIFLIFYLLA